MSGLFRDLRHAFRSLRRTPTFTSVAILVLALGIGANTAIFSVIEATMLRPLPYRDGERLVEIYETYPNGYMSPAYPDYLDWRAQADVFEEMTLEGVFERTLTGRGPAQRIGVKYVTSSFLRTYNTVPLLGRGFSADDDRLGAPAVALLSHHFWQREFGGRANVLGEIVTIDKVPHTIIGVLPASFEDSWRGEIYAPVSQVGYQYFFVRGNHDTVRAIARRKSGVTIEQVRAQMNTIAHRLERAYPSTNTGVGVRVRNMREVLTGAARQPTLMLFAAVGFVLLIACANVANLLLARATAREPEIAMRAALGAGRGRIVRQLLTESILLWVCGGALGITFAKSSYAGLIRLVPSASTVGGLALDWKVLAFALLVSCFTGVAFGLVPALKVSRADLIEGIRGGTAGRSARDSRRIRGVLVISEVALAFLVLAGAGLLLRSFRNLLAVDPGFNSDRVITMRVAIPFEPTMLFDAAPRFYEQLVERVQALPGVAHAGVVRHLQFAGGWSTTPYFVEGRPGPRPGQAADASYKVADEGFFRAMRIPLLKGRFPSRSDGTLPSVPFDKIVDKWAKNSTAVAVVSESFGRRCWPEEDPIGKRFRVGPTQDKGQLVTVVGVVGDVLQWGLETQPPPTFYYSFWQWPDTNMFLVVRTVHDPKTIVAGVREVANGIDKSAAVSDVRLMQDRVAASYSRRLVNTSVLGIFAALALLLAALGIYGVMSCTVARKTREIGVRIALGATSGSILAAVLREAGALAAAGLALGIAAAAGLTRLISAMLFGIKPFDAATLAATATVLMVVALLAAFVPAWRAMRVSPLSALRSE